MKIYAIGDLHLSFDSRIRKPMDVFGPAWVHHAQRLERNWRELVGEEDVVIVPGDLSWGLRLDEALEDLHWIEALPGRKVMVKGNHDLWWTSIGRIRKMFDEDRMVFLQNDSFCVPGTRLRICGTRGWNCPGAEGFGEHDEKIYQRELLRLEMSLADARKQDTTEIIGALHYPPTNEKKQPSGFTKLLSEYGVKTCVYGHLHGERNFRRGITGCLNGVNYRLTSLDYLDARPTLLKEIE